MNLKTLALYGMLTLAGLGLARGVGAEVHKNSVNCSCSGLENRVTQPAGAKVTEPAKTQTKHQINYAVKDFSGDTETILLARMLYGEARNCSNNERIAIAYTALNRNKDGKKWNGENDLKKVILCPYQYSAFNENDPNRKKLMDPQGKEWDECLDVAQGVLSGKYKNSVEGATHYHTRNINPKWTKSNTMVDLPEPKEFKHDFYLEKK